MAEKICYTRVLLGGLVAGLVINLGEFVGNGVLFADQIADVSDRLGLPTMGAWVMGAFVVGGFVLGLLIVWLYALARSRTGPGAKTALLMGLVAWFMAWAWPAFVNHGMGLYGAHLMLLGMLWSLVEVLAAAYVGGWLYRE